MVLLRSVVRVKVFLFTFDRSRFHFTPPSHGWKVWTLPHSRPIRPLSGTAHIRGRQSHRALQVSRKPQARLSICDCPGSSSPTSFSRAKPNPDSTKTFGSQCNSNPGPSTPPHIHTAFVCFPLFAFLSPFFFQQLPYCTHLPHPELDEQLAFLFFFIATLLRASRSTPHNGDDARNACAYWLRVMG